MKKNLLLLFSALLILSVSMNAQNLIVDGDFENGMTAWDELTTGVVAISDTEHNTGLYSLEIPTGTTTTLKQVLTVDEDATYNISFSAKWSALHAAQIKMAIRDNATDDLLHTTAGITNLVAWQTVNESITISAGVTELKISFWVGAASPTVYVDDISIIKQVVILPSITISDDGEIIEGAEDGEVITVNLENDTFAATLTPANWVVTNLPEGVTIASVTRVDEVTAELALSGNTTGDYDVDITNTTVTVAAAEFVISTDPIMANSGVTFVAIIEYTLQRIIDGDFEEGDLAVAWNPLSKRVVLETETDSVYEGTYSANLASDNAWGSALKQVFTVKSGYTYEVSFTAKWPQGAVADADGLTMKFTDNVTGDLIHITDGIATEVWSTLTDSITIPIGVDEVKLELWKKQPSLINCLVDSVSVLDIGAIYPMLAITDAGDIIEGAEEGKIITVNVVNYIFVDDLLLVDFFATNLPEGVSFGSVSRIDDVTAEITLAGNTTEDYDDDITNVEVFVGVDQFVEATDTLSATGITFTAIDEKVILSGLIYEDFEDLDTIFVNVETNTFVEILTPENWMVTNLPEGVTIGSVIRIEDDSVQLILSGNTTGDYDENITNTTVTVASEEFTLPGGAASANNGVTFVAAIEGGEELLWEDDFSSYADGTDLLLLDPEVYGFVGEIVESAIVTDGVVCMDILTAGDHRFQKLHKVELGKSYKYYATTKTDAPMNTKIAAFLEGVDAINTPATASDVWRTRSILFSPDQPEQDTVKLTVYSYPIQKVYIDNMKLYMLTDPMISAADDGDITEGSEDGEIISVTLQNATYVATLNVANWTLTNLPTGVSIGSVNRIDATQVEIVLSGNASEDYDVDVTDVTLSAGRDELVGSNKTLSTTEGVTFTAIVEPPIITISDDGEILEASEDLEVITVVLALDTFVVTLNPANYELTGQPAGVTIGEVYRVDDFTVEITLSGNATEDYDTDITDASLTVKAAELKTYGSDLLANTGVTFIATVETAIKNQLMDGLEVYPNPVSNMLNIASDTEIMKVQVYNALGNLMSIMDDLNSSAVKIDVEHWNSGMYFVSITDKKGNSSIVKIIK